MSFEHVSKNIRTCVKAVEYQNQIRTEQRFRTQK